MESTRQNNNINAINDVRMLRYELRNNLSREETKRIREKIYKKEAVYNFLIEKDRLTNKEKKVLKNIDRYLKNNSMHLKNLKKHFEKLQKYQYGIDYLLNEHNLKAISQITILVLYKSLESFLMNVEVIFFVKKQRELEKNFVE